MTSIVIAWECNYLNMNIVCLKANRICYLPYVNNTIRLAILCIWLALKFFKVTWLSFFVNCDVCLDIIQQVIGSTNSKTSNSLSIFLEPWFMLEIGSDVCHCLFFFSFVLIVAGILYYYITAAVSANNTVLIKTLRNNHFEKSITLMFFRI